VSRQTVLSVIRGTGPGAYRGPGSVPLRRGLLEPPAADPEGPCHLARFDPPALKVWVWLLLNRDHGNGTVLGDRRDMVNGTGMSSWRITKALKWLQSNPEGSPYVEMARAPGRGRPPLYRILRDESHRGGGEDAVDE